jgi:hypothetical protein
MKSRVGIRDRRPPFAKEDKLTDTGWKPHGLLSQSPNLRRFPPKEMIEKLRKGLIKKVLQSPEPEISGLH